MRLELKGGEGWEEPNAVLQPSQITTIFVVVVRSRVGRQSSLTLSMPFFLHACFDSWLIEEGKKNDSDDMSVRSASARPN
jgi:hypothetical protein